MGKTLRQVAFWANDFKVNEVISASDLKDFKLKSLKPLSKYRCSLSFCEETKTYFLEYYKNNVIKFIEFN